MRTKAFLTLILFLAASSVLAQPVEEWVARYNGPADGEDWANALFLDASGNVYVTGKSLGSDSGHDYLTIKYDSEGGELWTARYNGPGNNNDVAQALAVGEDGSVYVTGTTWGSNGLFCNYTTVKYDSLGNGLWAVHYDGPGTGGSDLPTALALGSSGDVYVTGFSHGSGTTFDYATIKYDSEGDSAWVARYNGPANWEDKANDLALDDSGNVYVTGWSYGSGPPSNRDYATIKYDSQGNQLWVARYNGPGGTDDQAIALTLDPSCNIYITGYSRGGPGYAYDYATIKYDSSGNELWVARHNDIGGDDDLAQALAVDEGGNVYVTGGGMGVDTKRDYLTVKYDSEGNELWAARYDGPGNSWDVAYDLAVDDSGNVYVTGARTGLDNTLDYATIKYDPDGNELWVVSYQGPGEGYDSPYDLTMDNSGNLYITGYSKGLGTDFDYATIKYSPAVTGIEATSFENATPGLLWTKAYPNPFNHKVAIVYCTASSGRVCLEIFDLLGRKVASLIDWEQPAGLHSIIWEAPDYASGIYFYRLTAGGFTETRRTTLLK